MAESTPLRSTKRRTSGIKPITPLKPSKSVLPHFDSPAKQSPESRIVLAFSPGEKRPTSVLSYGTCAPQGDHVTAYRLVEQGLHRILDDILKEEVDELHLIANRRSLRQRRSALYSYLSTIASLDPTRREELFLAVKGVFAVYNEKRHKKTEIRQQITQLHEDELITGEAYEEALKNQIAKFKHNGESMRNLLFIEISRLVLTFYNKIPHSSYDYIDGFREEGGDIKVSVNTLAGILKWIKQQQTSQQDSTSATLAVKRPDIVNIMNSLIHYPEITDKVKLEQHQSENIANRGDKGKDKARDNSIETLVEVLGKHITIFLSIYPELDLALNTNGELIDDFVDKFIGEKDKKPNWPSFVDAKIKLEIKQKVKNEVARLKAEVGVNHYKQWEAKQKERLDSSDDEKVSVKPKQKKPVQVVISDLKAEVKKKDEELEVRDIRLKEQEAEMQKLKQELEAMKQEKLKLEESERQLRESKKKLKRKQSKIREIIDSHDKKSPQTAIEEISAVLS
jgi:hypothetical protein